MYYSKNSQRTVIFIVTLGSILEWYEMFLYIYWTPVIANLFFPNLGDKGIIYALVPFALGLLGRVAGGLFFGHYGDENGRRFAFMMSIFGIGIPGLITTFLPTYQVLGVASPVLLTLARFLQGIPAGGELPGAMCYLSETASKARKRYVCSYSFLGAQIGGILGMIEAILLKTFLSVESLYTWGWRFSFAHGAILGLFGVFLRRRLSETPIFHKLETRHAVRRKTIFEDISNNKRKLVVSFLITIFEVTGYFMIAVFPITYFENIFGTSMVKNLIIVASLLTLSAIGIPFYGKLGDKYSNKHLFGISVIGVVALLYPLYIAINSASLFYTLVCQVALIGFFNIQLSLIPAFLTEIFPARVRFTCLGLSFNLCDSLIGGGIVPVAIYLMYTTGNAGLIYVGILTVAAISFLPAFFIKESKELE